MGVGGTKEGKREERRSIDRKQCSTSRKVHCLLMDNAMYGGVDSAWWVGREGSQECVKQS